MTSPALVLSAAAAVAAPSHASGAASPALLSSTVFREQEVRSPDGRVHVQLAPAAGLTSGERVVFVLTLRNIGVRATTGVVVTNPLPSGVAFAGPRDGAGLTASVDGRTFASLAELFGPAAQDAAPARLQDVKSLRWAIPGSIPPDGEIRLSYRARLRG